MLVGHGTRDEEGTRQFFVLGERLAETLSPIPVQPCLLEFQSPTIPEAWETLVDSGVKHIHVAPLLLFAAGHAKSDIPDLVRQCQAGTPEVTFSQSRSLSRHSAIIKLVAQRIQESSRQIQTPRSRTALIMVGRGSHDPCAQSDMKVLTEIVGRRLNIEDAFTSFYAMTDPRLPEVIDRVASTGRFDAVLVQPHLLFAGRLYEAISDQVQDADDRHPNLTIYLSKYLGPHRLAAEAIAERIRSGQAS